MPTAAVFMINGFEETEFIAPVDILRRGNVEVTTVSLSGSLEVTGGHNVKIKADSLIKDIQDEIFDMLIIPGGSRAYADHEGLLSMVQKHDKQQKLLAAICAAPCVYGKLGLLNGKNAICYPGIEPMLTGASIVEQPVVTDGRFTTSKGPGTAVHFGLALLEILQGKTVAHQVKETFIAQIS